MPETGQRVTVVGAGTMGTGIAICALLPGHDVTLIDLDADPLEDVRDRVAGEENPSRLADQGTVARSVPGEVNHP